MENEHIEKQCAPRIKKISGQRVEKMTGQPKKIYEGDI